MFIGLGLCRRRSVKQNTEVHGCLQCTRTKAFQLVLGSKLRRDPRISFAKVHGLYLASCTNAGDPQPPRLTKSARLFETSTTEENPLADKTFGSLPDTVSIHGFYHVGGVLILVGSCSRIGLMSIIVRDRLGWVVSTHQPMRLLVATTYFDLAESRELAS
jgi:hypothetical protein